MLAACSAVLAPMAVRALLAAKPLSHDEIRAGHSPASVLLAMVGGALASLTAAHPSNRDKVAARHCISSLLSLAQSEIVTVQRDALRALAAMALQPATKEEFIAEGALQLLLDSGVLSDAEDNHGCTPLDMAAQKGHWKSEYSTMVTLAGHVPLPR